MSNENLAQDVELKEWEFNNRARNPVVKFSQKDAEFGPEFCVKCDESMPLVRRQYGYKLCVTCKSKEE
jgi:hypothetical protein